MNLPLLSASQISVFTDCERKWAFQYVEKRERTTHPSATLGTEVQDEQLDPWLTDGRAFDFTRPSGEIANALVPLLPKPKAPGMQLRRWFGLPNPPKPGALEILPTSEELASRAIPSPRGTFAYRGELDIYAPDSAIVPGLAVANGGVALVGDIKTTSNLAYAKTTDGLREDIQAQLYAMTIMFAENVDVVDLVWFYVRTRKPHRVQRTHLRVHASQVVEQFQRIDAIGARLVTIKSAKPNAEDLPPNVRMCESYGGCPFRHVCSGATSPLVQADAINQEAIQMNTSFLNNLRKQVAAPIEAIPAPTPARELVPAEQVTAPTSPPAWLTAPVDPRAPKPAINPPESALPPAPPVGAVTSAPEAPKPRRGRPPKSEIAPSASTEPSEPAAPSGVGLGDLEALAPIMRSAGVKRIKFDGESLVEIELFEVAS